MEEVQAQNLYHLCASAYGDGDGGGGGGVSAVDGCTGGGGKGSVIIGRAKRAPHWGVQSRFRVIYIYIYIGVCLSYVKLTA